MADKETGSSKAALRTVQQGHSPTVPRSTHSIAPATALHTQGHPLVKMHGDWGVYFVGTKDELQAAGFGLGCIFPGEPGGNKKKATLPPCNGFAKVEVCIYSGCFWLGEPSQFILPNYAIRASYIEDEFDCRREFAAAPNMPDVLLHRATRADVYRGSDQALIAASLIEASQLPGQDGCGKMRTTFTREGFRIKRGSKFQDFEGNKTVMAVGKLFEVAIRVSDQEREKRHSAWSERFDIHAAEFDRRVADYLQKIALQATDGKSPTKNHLKLVWSAS